MAVLLLAVGCRSAEQKFARFMASGKEHLQKKDYSRATLEFRNAVKVNPKSAEPYYQLALVSLAERDMRNAVGYLRKATELDPKHRDAQLKLADLMTTSRNKEILEEAAKRAQDVLARSPMDPDALNTLALAEWRLGKPEEAEQHLEQAFQKAPQNLRSSILLAKVKLGQKDSAGAEEILKKVVEASPGKVEPVMTLGAFYAATNRPGDAEQQLRRALQIDPKSGLVLVSLAGMKLRAGLTDEAGQLYKQAASASDPRYKPVYAFFLLQSGKQDLAITEFEKLAQVDPEDRQARTNLVTAYLAVKRVADAEKILGTALQQNPRDSDALIQRSQIYLQRAKYKEAQADLTQALKFVPDSAAAHHLMAKVHQGGGATLQQRQELVEALRLSPGLLAARIDLAQLLTSANRAKSALDVLNEAPPAQKNTLGVVFQQNWAHLALGNKTEAAQGIQKALAIAKTPDVLIQNSVLKVMQQDYAGARQSAEEALKASPESLNALKVLVYTYTAQKQTAPAALQRLRSHASQYPKSALVQQFLGEQLALAGDRAEARNAFNAARASSPGYRVADVSLAQLEISEGKIEEARERLSGLVASNPSEVTARLLLAGLEVRVTNFADAVEGYRKIIAIDEQNLVALNNLAFILAEHAKKPDEALKFAEKARELAPESPDVLDTLGWVYYRKGLYPTAIQQLELAVSKGATPLRRCHLGLAYIKAGDRPRGQKLIDSVLQTDPKFGESGDFKSILAEVQ